MSAPERKPRRLLISGATGLIGKAVAEARRAAGDEVVALVRGGPQPGAVSWSSAGELDPAAVSGFDAVIHLAGEPVGNGRWTAAKKQRIRESRVDGTRKLAEALAQAAQPPAVFVCASGINFYGDAGDTLLEESAAQGRGFLAEVCTAWEAAAAPLAGCCRIVNLRIGVVLTPTGGTLALMLPLFRMGLAGPIAGGSAFVSWVTLHDVVRSIGHLLEASTLTGPVNVVAPEPIQGRAFTAAVAAAVGKPARIPVPAWAARLLMGGLADETVLASIRAIPLRLLEDGFVFQQPRLQDALTAWDLREGGKRR